MLPTMRSMPCTVPLDGRWRVSHAVMRSPLIISRSSAAFACENRIGSSVRDAPTVRSAYPQRRRQTRRPVMRGGLNGPPDRGQRGRRAPARLGPGLLPMKEKQMGFMDKLRNRFQMAKGHGEERAGRGKGDPDLEARGTGDRVEGGTRQVGEQVKDVGKNVRDTFKR